MRFEEMSKYNQLRNLVRLHNTLNNGLFNGKLTNCFYIPPFEEWGGDSFTPPHDRIELNINSLNLEKQEEGIAACYHITRFKKEGYNGFLYNCKIIIDYDFIHDDIRGIDTVDKQIKLISSVLLHEMIHQYLFETKHRFKQSHNSTFLLAGLDHGYDYAKMRLQSDYNYLGLEDVQEPFHPWYDLLPEAEAVIEGFSFEEPL